LEGLAKITNEGTVRLDVLQSHVKQLRRGVTVTEIGKVAQEQLRELLSLSEAAYHAVAQKIILESLAFSGMYGRFEEVDKAHLSTFGWLYCDKPSPENDPVIESLHHYDSDEDQNPHEDSSSGHQSRQEDDTNTSPLESRSKEEEDASFDKSNNGKLQRRQDSANEKRTNRGISPDPVPEKQPQKNNKIGEDDAPVQREKWTNWLSSGNGIFHIAGKLGSGKSTLMKFLCNHPQTKVALQYWAGMFKLHEKCI
jgi:hypothetical protein